MKRLNNKGSAVVLMCVFLTVLCGFAAYIIDIGLVYTEKIKLSNALDSAALAASLELPADSEKAKNTALEYLAKNSVDLGNAAIAVTEDKKGVLINGIKNVKHLFMPLLGINSSNIKAGTKSVIAPAKTVKGGIRPFAVQKFDYIYGDQVILKEGAGDAYHGNFGVVALGGQGEVAFRENALTGFKGKLSVGEYINTEPGNMSGATSSIENYISTDPGTFDNFSRDSKRLWTLPLVDTLMVDGRGMIRVTGFAQFFVENASQRAGKMELTGRFIRYVLNAEIDPYISDTGVYGVKLVK